MGPEPKLSTIPPSECRYSAINSYSPTIREISAGQFLEWVRKAHQRPSKLGGAIGFLSLLTWGME